jgi:membrane-associated PAP2 superfamily phosphatase
MNLSPDFMSGLITATFVVCALFFARFWRRTRDALFLGFATAFLLLALGQALTAVMNLEAEERTWIYLIRLAAFVILIVTIIRKNLAR